MSPRLAPAVALALVATAACRAGGERAEASFTDGHPLAMRAPAGTAPLDRRIGDLQARLRRAPRSPEAWTDLAEAWVRKARADADAGLYHGAGDAAAAALEVSPGAPRALLVRGLVLLDGHRFEEARALAEELVARAPGLPAAHGLLSDALLELGRYAEAAEAAQRMMDSKPSLPAYLRASHLLWLRGDVAGALEAARLAVDAAGDAEARAWARTQAALVRWHSGEYASADAELARALAEAPDHAPALVARGRVALSRRDFQAARAHLERAFPRAPLPETAWLLGDARAGAGDGPGAEDAYARVERDGRAVDPRTLALFLATRGGPAATGEAVRLAEAERRVRDDVYSQDAHAWALYRAGRLDEADQAARLATQLGTPDARLLFHAGAIRLARGDRKGGVALLGRALRLNPEFDVAGAAEARRLLAGANRSVAAARRGLP
jgi:tetratricopeptide (TPR) repeat protein